MNLEQDYLISLQDVYSLSSTSSILIQGFPLEFPLFNNFKILKTEITIIGIHKIFPELSTIQI